MIVTVQETIEHSRDITAEMVEVYLSRHRWFLCYDGLVTKSWSQDGKSGSACATLPHSFADTRDGQECLARVVGRIAQIELRQPHEVLADIAEGR